MFKVGDRVKVIKEYHGTIYWNPLMTRYIGHTGTIKAIGYRGILIDFDNSVILSGEYINYPWHFPIQSIIKVGHQLEFSFMQE